MFNKEKKVQKKTSLPRSSAGLKNAANTLYSNIRFMESDHEFKAVAVTSSVPNEGKSTISMFLAQAAANTGMRTLLIEGDMRRPTLSKFLTMRPGRGIHALLRGEATPAEVIQKTSVLNLYFLDSEVNIIDPLRIVSSRKFKALIDEFKKQFDFIVIDTPPASNFVDSSVIANVADGVVIVEGSNLVKRETLQKTYEQLSISGANVLGICENYSEKTDDEYYYNYYNAQTGKKIEKKK
ncbi:MAG: CpsD/CapB family tyrosine-protein kinase [Phoenicibacter congonensis]|uniref:non-specific protein-tyrosine kinase n=1 Tax=Phoenicibacter congonensis TaxID=1944646 RepID=A0AA43RHE6_9ACTN|nr:CpsD/CapB family tyrosine-protein kinase [Phoenicibacter congonensis]